MNKILVTALWIATVLTSCKKEDQDFQDLSGKYAEQSPSQGRSFLEFTGDGKVTRTERGSTVADVFTYTLTDSSITLVPTWTTKYKTNPIYFRRLSNRAFEIEYMYLITSPKQPAMLFERE